MSGREILPLHSVQGFGSRAQDDRAGRLWCLRHCHVHLNHALAQRSLLPVLREVYMLFVDIFCHILISHFDEILHHSPLISMTVTASNQSGILGGGGKFFSASANASSKDKFHAEHLHPL